MGESKFSSFLTIFFSITINFFLLSFLVDAPWSSLFTAHDAESLLKRPFQQMSQPTAEAKAMPEHLEAPVAPKKNVATFRAAPAPTAKRVVEVKVQVEAPKQLEQKPVEAKAAEPQQVVETADPQPVPEPDKLIPIEEKIAGVQAAEDEDELTEATAADAYPSASVPSESTVLED